MAGLPLLDADRVQSRRFEVIREQMQHAAQGLKREAGDVVALIQSCAAIPALPPQR